MDLKNIDLLMELHLLMVKGEDESTEANDIRDKLADEWYKLTQTEREWLDNFSSKLYDLKDIERS